MKKKLTKALCFVLAAAVILFGGALTYVKSALPNVGEAPNLKITKTTAQIERGKYLAHHVMVCIDCHSTRDWSKFSGPPVAGTFGKGGEIFNQDLGFPGSYYARNITPAGLGTWTDGEIFRAITSGVSKNGDALFPVMPHHLYGQLDKNDIEAVIAYVRTLKPIENQVPGSASDFPMNFIINTIPAKPNLQPMPDINAEIAYGKYLITASGCVECHSKKDKGQNIPGTEFGGGFEFKFPSGDVVRSMNITPDPETGIGNWTKQAFINRFKMHGNGSQPVAKGGFNTPMPWTMYAGMKEEDLGAIYAYLQTVPEINNKVVRFTPAAQ